MEILVCVKRVPDTAENEISVNSAGNDIERGDLVYSVNEWDNYAVEEAIQIVDRVGGNMTVVAVGDDEWPLRGEVADMSLRSADTSILDVLPGPEEDQLVLVGAGVGATSLRVLIQGVQVDSLSVQVIPQ